MNIVKIGKTWINLNNVAYIQDDEGYMHWDTSKLEPSLIIVFNATAEDEYLQLRLFAKDRAEFLDALNILMASV